MYKKILKTKKTNVYSRDIKIYPKLIGLELNVYNGHRFTKVKINSKMLGHRIGEFSKTRVSPKHPVKKKKK